MEVDNKLIKELLQFTTAIVGNLTEEQEERLRQSFNTVLCSYFISSKKTNVVVMGEGVDIKFVREHLSRLNMDDVLVQIPTPTVGMIDKDSGHYSEQSSFPLKVECGVTVNDIMDSIHTIKLINPHIETVYDSGVVLSYKPHQHPHKKRNKFKPSKISHKRRK